MMDIMDALNTGMDIRFKSYGNIRGTTEKSIKAKLIRWNKEGVVATADNKITINIDGIRKITLDTKDIIIEKKKVSKSEALLKSLEVI